MTSLSENRELVEENRKLQAHIDFLKSQQNKLGMNFERHPEQGEAQLLAQGKLPYLTFQPEHSTIKPDRSEKDIPHLLIEGDNISTLTALQATHRNRVDAIYIDPPYNTGHKDFVYNDSFVSFDDSFRHSKWLAFMESRLTLSKELLKDTGVIIVAIGDDEHHRLRMLMDSVFGEQNFIANITWQGNGSFLARHHAGGADYMLVYGKNADLVDKFLDPKQGIEGMKKVVEEAITGGSSMEEAQQALRSYIDANANSLTGGAALFNKVDSQGRIYDTSALTNSLPRPNLRYPVTDPKTGISYESPDNGWKVKKDVMEDLISNDLLVFNGKYPRKKKILSEYGYSMPTPTFTQARTASGNHLRAVLGDKKFPFPKDHTVLMRWLRMVAPKDAVILDFFAGSGTTAEAVIRLNAEDGGTRQCILATSNFEEDGSPNGIARDITAERVKRVLTGENWADGKAHEVLPGELKYYRVEFADELDEAHALGAINVKENAYAEIPQSVSQHMDAYRAQDGRLVAVWNSLFRLGYYDAENPVMFEIEAANDWLAQQGGDIVWYVPTDNTDYDDFIAFEDLFEEGKNVITVKSYSRDYANTARKTVNTLLNTSMIVPMEPVQED